MFHLSNGEVYSRLCIYFYGKELLGYITKENGKYKFHQVQCEGFAQLVTIEGLDDSASSERV